MLYQIVFCWFIVGSEGLKCYQCKGVDECKTEKFPIIQCPDNVTECFTIADSNFEWKSCKTGKITEERCTDMEFVSADRYCTFCRSKYCRVCDKDLCNSYKNITKETWTCLIVFISFWHFARDWF